MNRFVWDLKREGPDLIDGALFSLAYLYSHVYPAYGRPTQGDYLRFDDLDAEIAPHLEAIQEVVDEDLAAFNEALRAAGVPAVILKR